MSFGSGHQPPVEGSAAEEPFSTLGPLIFGGAAGVNIDLFARCEAPRKQLFSSSATNLSKFHGRNHVMRSLGNMKITLASVLITGSLIAGSALSQAMPQEQSGGTQSNQPVDDTWITTKVKTELLAAKDIPGTSIDVETTNGVVVLSGTLESQKQVDRAVAAAKAVRGVKEVDAAGLVVKGGQ